MNEIDAHVCQGGTIKGTIRKYSSMLCSLCHKDAVEVQMRSEDIDMYNKKLKAKQKGACYGKDEQRS